MSPVPAIDSRASFHAALAWGLQSAIKQGARRIFCCDPDFSLWAWDDADNLARLAAWMRQPQRSLVLLARHYDAMPRCHPRFSRWRADWTHAIAAWQVVDESPLELPSVMTADRPISVQLIDAAHWRGRASDDEQLAQRWRGSLDILLQRSEPGFAVRTLGL